MAKKKKTRRQKELADLRRSHATGNDPGAFGKMRRHEAASPLRGDSPLVGASALGARKTSQASQAFYLEPSYYEKEKIPVSPTTTLVNQGTKTIATHDYYYLSSDL